MLTLYLVRRQEMAEEVRSERRWKRFEWQEERADPDKASGKQSFEYSPSTLTPSVDDILHRH